MRHSGYDRVANVAAVEKGKHVWETRDVSYY